jgi:hypothetical protein
LTINRMFPAIARQRANTVRNLIALEQTKASEDLAKIPIEVEDTRFREEMNVRLVDKQNHQDVDLKRYRQNG